MRYPKCDTLKSCTMAIHVDFKSDMHYYLTLAESTEKNILGPCCCMLITVARALLAAAVQQQLPRMYWTVGFG